MAMIIKESIHSTKSSQRITRQVEVHMYDKGSVNLKKEMRGCYCDMSKFIRWGNTYCELDQWSNNPTFLEYFGVVMHDSKTCETNFMCCLCRAENSNILQYF